jgi:hypothetical protein
MFGTRQGRGPVRSRSVLALSVLALLALGSIPVPAQAEDSSGIQYSDAPPTATGKNTIPTQKESTKHSSNKSGGAGASNSPGAGGGSNGGGSPGGGSSAQPGGAKAGAGGAQQGSQGQGGGNGGSGQTNQSAQNGSPASADSGGSSPLVPILIAVAALAAISIGAVVMQRRRRDSDTSVSPKAG